MESAGTETLGPRTRTKIHRHKQRQKLVVVFIVCAIVLIILLATWFALTSENQFSSKTILTFAGLILALTIIVVIYSISVSEKFFKAHYQVVETLQKQFDESIGWKKINHKIVNESNPPILSGIKQWWASTPSRAAFAARGLVGNFQSFFIYREWYFRNTPFWAFEIRITLRGNVPGSVWIAYKELPMHEGGEIHLESNEFNELTTIRANPPALAQQILTPSVMDWYQNQSQHATVCIEGSQIVLLQKVSREPLKTLANIPNLIQDGEYLATTVNDLFSNEA